MVNIPMQDAYIEDHTPKPKKRNYTKWIETEDEDSQLDHDEVEYETPKALKKRAPVSIPDPDSSSDTDSVEFVDSHADPDHEWKGEDERYTESDNGSDIYVVQKKRTDKSGNKKKPNRGDVQEFKSIDLAKMQKKAKGGIKEKKAFRKQVDEKRAVISKKDRKDENVR